ncbi:GNAT family N-acetyltransferase [Pedobacter sp. SYSU D00535]|uniref:GNAT family N-acetyltransferase n=1 Tax=Pedobacter sp. SYSU D00535 TaxID=2810308 RepID=UPI001A9774A9|nr:GNAT family N-acetyltransferase [Pedobacter sp. SYSU D00535]
MIIRKASCHDAAPIAACLLLAMEEIIYKLTGLNDRRQAERFLYHFAMKEGNQYSFENCWVAERGTEVVAAVNVYDGALLRSLRQPILDYLKSEFNRDAQPEDETAAGEFYIDSLGVKQGYQGKGIGTEMLKFLTDEFVTRRHQTLGLLVDPGNQSARSLYQKLGFRLRDHLTFMGKEMEHLQLEPF